MKSDYLTLNIPENLVREWFRSVGAEIVVRCRDCKHYHTEKDRAKPKACDLFNFEVDEMDYCSRGWKKFQYNDNHETLVRCRDCEYWNRNSLVFDRNFCELTSTECEGDHFCSWGEKKNGT